MFSILFSDALDGFGITECGSLACLSNPCRNGAVCIELNDEDAGSDDDDRDYINDDVRNHFYNHDNDEDDGYHIHMLEMKRGAVSTNVNAKKQHDKWKCKCPTGYMGDICEISVCDDNPCQYGATCVTFPGSGYLCLCPLGKHGHYCEHSKYIKTYIFICI